MVELGKVLEAIQLKPRYLLPVALATAAALYLPTSILKPLALDNLDPVWRRILGAVLLVSTALLASHLCIWLAEGTQAKRKAHKNEEARRKKLQGSVPG